jgi:hypothetical protein
MMEGGGTRELTNDVGHGLPAAVLLLGLHGAALVIGGHQLVVLLLRAILLPLLLMLPIAAAAAGISCFHDGWVDGLNKMIEYLDIDHKERRHTDTY